MVGFNDNTISAENIVAFIQEKYPNSPMLNEADIGNCFISDGQSNNVNPAFLVATACLEGGFGTLGWANSHPECHNTFGYGIPSGTTLPDDINCMDSWCAMIQRVASVIAHGHNYYAQGLYTVNQVRSKYAASPNADSIASLMNELYTFSVNHKAITASNAAVEAASIGTQPAPQTNTQEDSQKESSAEIQQPVNKPLPSGASITQMTTALLPNGAPQSFAADTDGKLWSCWKQSPDKDSSWNEWSGISLPSGVYASQVALVTLSDGRLELWVVNVNGKLWISQKQTTATSASWTGWMEVVIPRQIVA